MRSNKLLESVSVNTGVVERFRVLEKDPRTKSVVGKGTLCWYKQRFFFGDRGYRKPCQKVKSKNSAGKTRNEIIFEKQPLDRVPEENDAIVILTISNDYNELSDTKSLPKITEWTFFFDIENFQKKWKKKTA